MAKWSLTTDLEETSKSTAPDPSPNPYVYTEFFFYYIYKNADDTHRFEKKTFKNIHKINRLGLVIEQLIHHLKF